jgi:predicted HD phosphohydrolase
MMHEEPPMTVADEVMALFEAKGDEYYGEAVDQRSHALQCAAEAQARGAHDSVVVACLLHDIGHFLVEDATVQREDLSLVDDRHEAAGSRWLAPRFGPAVANPVALHVVAKRWRCTVDPRHHASLSGASQATLVAQGGLLGADEVRRFEQSPGFEHAVLVRDCDEAAKEPGRSTGRLDDYVALMERLAVTAITSGYPNSSHLNRASR